MKLSKILKKESVVLNDGKYTIPVSPGPANPISSPAGKKASGNDAASKGSLHSYNNSYPEDSEKTRAAGVAEMPEASETAGNPNNLDNLDYAGNLGGFADDYPDYTGYFETDGYANPDDVNSRNYADNLNIQNNPDMQNIKHSQGGAREKTTELIGDEIIAQSQKTAEIIISHALETAQRELNDVVSQGYKDGYEDGKSEALKIIEPSMLKINIMVDSIKKMQDKMLDEFKGGMFNIISEISRKILHKEITEKDEYLVELFADAVKNIKAEEYVTVTVSGAQINFAMRNIDLFRAEVANISDFKIIPDKNAEKGTMVVETANALADASYAVQQEKIDSIISQMRDNLKVLNSSPEFEENSSPR